VGARIKSEHDGRNERSNLTGFVRGVAVKVSDFDFELPRERIALRPVVPRDAARMLVVEGDAPQDSFIRDLPGFLEPGDLMVFNDTKVIPARLFGKRRTANVEVTLHKRARAGAWFAFARPAKRLAFGDRVDFGALTGTVVEKRDAGEILLDFATDDATLMAGLAAAGAMPLPPYIAGQRPADARDQEDYQTIFARHPGAVASPTAGLHFTDGLLRALEQRGVSRVSITLHVGAGTFLPVKAEDTADHKMHGERGEVSTEAAALINEARGRSGRIVAVGTTVLRLLEAASAAPGKLEQFAGETDIFITPGYKFKGADKLVTNFHLPRSTLFMLVSAYAGTDAMKAAYAHAIAEKYRFYSYGDACLLTLSPEARA
jgi:S-adenosylmethionine:tRNA ribosyltransferase-isomerase